MIRSPMRCGVAGAVPILTVAGGLMLGACTGPGQYYDPWDVDVVAARGPLTGVDAYPAALFETYVALAREEVGEGDWDDTRFFLDKARMLLAGDVPPPTALDARDLSPEWQAPLGAARARFMAARIGGARSLAPLSLAEAQGAFECWLQEAEENRPWQVRAELAVCQDGFAEAMAAVDEGLSSDAVVLLPGPDGAVGAVQVHAAGTAGEGLTLDTAGSGGAVGASDTAPRALAFIAEDTRTLFGGALDARPAPPVRFALDGFVPGDARLPAGADAVLSAIVAEAEARPAYDVVVVGFADTVGDSAVNRRLGSRRAAVVRDRLARAGLRANLIAVASEGETMLAVETADNVNEERNRRVVVTVR